MKLAPAGSLFAVVVVVVCGMLLEKCPAQVAATRAATGSTVSATMKFEITAEKTQLIMLDVLLPQTEARRQKMVALDYSVQPHALFEKDSQQYAQFRFTKFPTQLTISLQAELYRYDLATAREAPLRSAETKRSLAQWLIYEHYLEKDNAGIQAAARTLSGKTEEEVVQACFDHTVSTLARTAYVEQDVGARRAIFEKKGDCTEFADVFIALCRAKGIPARFCQGYLFEPTQDTHKHDWAEVHFEKYGWVPFDPLYAHLKRRTTFSELRPIYLPVERQRRNGVLNLNHFWSYRYEGDGPTQVKDTFTVISREELPAN